MPKSIVVSQIEQQIESLPPVEQIMMIERITRHLKQLLIAHPVTQPLPEDGKNITASLNHLYQHEQSGLEPHLLNVQLTAVGRDRW